MTQQELKDLLISKGIKEEDIFVNHYIDEYDKNSDEPLMEKISPEKNYEGLVILLHEKPISAICFCYKNIYTFRFYISDECLTITDNAEYSKVINIYKGFKS